MLYFYENSNEINNYFNKYLKNLGDYNFQKYLSDISNNGEESNIDDISVEQTIENSENEIEKKQEDKESILVKINRLIKKLKATDYFFFITPIHFKLSVIHQDIPFIVIFKFNGLRWKISSLKINYEKIITL